VELTIGAKLLNNYPFLGSLIIFGIGCYTVLSNSNLLKKLLGINIMESSIFLFYVATGNIRGGVPPIVDLAQPEALYINPLPTGLMLTGIVVSISVTGFALALIIKLYRFYGTMDANEIFEIRNEGKNNGSSS